LLLCVIAPLFVQAQWDWFEPVRLVRNSTTYTQKIGFNYGGTSKSATYLKVYISLPTTLASEPEVDSSFVLGYQSTLGHWHGTILIVENLLNVNTIASTTLPYCEANGYSLVLRPTNISGIEVAYQPYYLKGIQVIGCGGSNTYHSLSSALPLRNYIRNGGSNSADTANMTSYYVDFYGKDMFGFSSQSYGHAYVAGQIAYVKDSVQNKLGRTCSWWEARYRCIMTGSQGGIFNQYNGYGKINVLNAINYSGIIIPDPYFDITVAVPVLATPTNNATNQSVSVTLDWNDVTHAETYQVLGYTDTSSSAVFSEGGLSTSTYLASGLTANTSYWWKVRAMNVFDTSAYSAYFKFTTGTIPSTFHLLTPSNGAIDVSLTPSFDWQNATGATTYTLGIYTNSNCTSILTEVSNIATSDYTFVSPVLTGGTTYYWRAFAVNGAGTSNALDTFSFITIGASSPPLAPNLLFPEDGDVTVSFGHGVTFEWEGGGGEVEDNYQIQIATDSLFSSIIFDDTQAWDITANVGDGEFSTLTHYFWRVRASNSAGNSSWSSTFDFTTTL